uniref:Alphaalpha-trehalose-phosphate synthase n=1 Tax=Trifolium medium TaxID=97028 RepID=A0A392P7Z3_9FABA
MPGNKYNGDSNHIPGRVERLLRDRELRKSGNRGIQSNNEQLLGDEYLEQEDQKKDHVEKVARVGNKER